MTSTFCESEARSRWCGWLRAAPPQAPRVGQPGRAVPKSTPVTRERTKAKASTGSEGAHRGHIVRTVKCNAHDGFDAEIGYRQTAMPPKTESKRFQ